ncbi:hypothetical protein [Bacillus swezeyi]|uniref:hypothetical protein n=1 Tax=Bacillus swezeyi TaxID=1925020 RepID=UPI003F8A9D6A
MKKTTSFSFMLICTFFFCTFYPSAGTAAIRNYLDSWDLNGNGKLEQVFQHNGTSMTLQKI